MLKKFASIVCVGLMTLAFVGCEAQTTSTPTTTTEPAASEDGAPAEDGAEAAPESSAAPVEGETK